MASLTFDTANKTLRLHKEWDILHTRGVFAKHRRPELQADVGMEDEGQEDDVGEKTKYSLSLLSSTDIVSW